MPRLSIDLAIDAASLSTMAGNASKLAGDAPARVRLTGSGNTIRDVVTRSYGKLSLVARNRELSRRYADVLGFDMDQASCFGRKCARSAVSGQFRDQILHGVGQQFL